jgi:hypothetical protein
MRLHRSFSILVCSSCKRNIEPGQRFHVITDSNGHEKSFCERYFCQAEMYQLKEGQQSGGVKRPAKI